MNILWLTNSPCSSIERTGGKTILGGWLSSLEKEVLKHSDITLSIAYLSNIKEPPYNYNNVIYYPIYLGSSLRNNKAKKLIESRQTIKQKEQRAIPQILEAIEKCKPDLIHIHGTEELWGKITQYVSKIPIVFSIQGLLAPIKEKYFIGLSKKSVRKFDSFVDKLVKNDVNNLYQSFIYRAARENGYLRYAEYIFGRTQWDSNCTLALNPARKYYLVNELLRDPFYNYKWHSHFCNNSKIRIVSTISGGTYKGFETALHTAHILQTYSKIDFEWHIVGYNKDSKWCKAAELEKRLKVSDYPFVFHGRLDADSLAQLLSESDIYVQVSHIENSPNSVCEAMLVGVPTIASFAGGTSSILKDGEEGILVQDGDPYVLAGSIVHLVQNPDLAMFYSNNAKCRALQRHNPENVYKELLSGYTSILSSYNSNDNR